MVAVRSALLKTAALAVALFASKAVAQTPQPASDAPTTAPSPSPTPTSTPAPATTTATPSTTVMPGSQSLTAPTSCSNPTLNIANNQIRISCNDNQTASSVALGSFTELTVTVESPSLDVKQFNESTISALTINGGGDANSTKPNLQFDGGVTGFTKLTSLSLSKVHFANLAVNLQIPDSLAYLKIEASNLESLSFTVSEKSGFNQIDLLNNHISEIPKCLYERKYNSSVNAKVEFVRKKQEQLAANELAVLKANVNTTSFVITSTCSVGTKDALTGDITNSDGTYEVCPDSSTTTTPSTTTKPSSSATPAPSPAPSPAKSSSSNTTLIVIIIVVVVVVLLLAVLLYCRLSKTRKNKSSSSNENAVNLIGRDDASGNEKLSFISSDESLRALRLQQNEVTLSKSLGGTGKLWLGEFAGAKVIIKRVEAEVSDAYVTKNLMNQSQVLASISHESIVPLVGVTWLAGTDFAVVAEFMDKSNLKHVLADANWQLDIQTKLRMCLDIARGLAYLHDPERNMYVHNLSSGKVLVNSSSECKLNLFDCYPSTTKFELPVETYGAGELAWQAPELITRSAPQDLRKINMYAFGVIMCEILARASPFQSLVDEVGNTLSDVEIVKRVRRQETLAPHENRREYMRAPQSLRDTVDLCLSLSPLTRPSASEIIVAIEAAQVEVSATQQLV
ncbi:Tkl protein kinase [Globisporangium polare]